MIGRRTSVKKEHGMERKHEKRREKKREPRKDGQNRYKDRVNQCTYQIYGDRWISC
jgi:hypothetical protein